MARQTNINGATSTVPPEKFVRAWLKFGSQAEIAAALGISESAVRSRAELYRLRGVQLPPLRKTLGIGYRKKVLNDTVVQELNRIIASYVQE